MISEIFSRRLGELDFFRGEKIGPGHFLYVSPERQDAFRRNPYLEDKDSICEWVGYADGKPAGFNYSFPIRVWADGKSYRSTTGSSLNVQEWARKTDLGLILPAKGVELTGKDGIAIAASCSQAAIPLHKINGYKYFFMPRYIALWKSRSVIEMFVSRFLFWPCTLLLDAFLLLYRACLKTASFFTLSRYIVTEVDVKDDEALKTMAEIVAADKHRFREDHDVNWFRWHMTCSFSKEGPCRAYLLKSRKDNRCIAFALLKRRFHEQASHRGFKNVWLASLMDWGTVPGCERMLKWFVLDLGLRNAYENDAFEFATDDDGLRRFVRRLGWRRVGDSNVGVKVMKNFPFYGDKAVKEQFNWRIRPGMGDNALS